MKQILTPEKAEEFARQHFGRMLNPEDREFSIKHIETVVQTVSILCKEKGIDKEALEIASWLHDIGYIISRENHAQHSLEILEKEGFELNEKIKDCILNHGNSGNPKTEEGRIIKIADKLSAINPELIKIFMKYSAKKIKEEKNKDLEFIRKLANQGIDLLKDYS